MDIKVWDNEAGASQAAARYWCDKIRDGARVLCLATGNTPVAFYREWSAMMRQDRLLSQLTTFNLDEYWGLPPGHPGSFRRYMEVNLFEPLGLHSDQVHFLPSCLQPPSLQHPEETEWDICQRYEEEISRAGGIDLCLLGIGENGHIGFNEPGSPVDGGTHLVALTEKTRRANQTGFQDHTPERALTMGLQTIVKAKEIVLLAFGAQKAQALHDAFFGPLSEACPASVLQRHPRVTAFLDREAAHYLPAYRS